MPFRDFSPYLSEVFIETGSYLGDGIEAALSCGFNTVVSIELSRKYYDHCYTRFWRNSNVHLWQGDTSVCLYDIASRYEGPTITFYLDGHWSMEDTAKGYDPYPLLAELDQIAKLKRNDYTIIIDDVRLFTDQWGTTVETVIEKLKSINPKYTITFLDGFTSKDVLVVSI